ncbi:MAG TPA: hypothetical protein VFB38_16345 [Chthonomonadaceae bacterium]|nr:hypothetical protein [Chthonomonadaceae bacterium]
MSDSSQLLEQLLAEIGAGPKYRHVSADLVRRIGQRELAARRSFNEAVHATRNKLHQIAGAYLGGRMRYTKWLDLLAAAAPNGDPALRDACAQIMAYHASTRERLSILAEFYRTTLAQIAPICSVLDVACGLNPLALPWMGLDRDVAYYACDIYADMMDFLNGFFAIAGVPGCAEVCDVVGGPPAHSVDLALALKTLPPLEQVEKAAGLNLLKALRARHILVSFPTHSLGGRDKQMRINYEQRFREMVRAERWTLQRFEFATELCFLLST